MKTQVSLFLWAKIGQNDHSNPYIESTTVLSDNNVLLGQIMISNTRSKRVNENIKHFAYLHNKIFIHANFHVSFSFGYHFI